MKSHRIPFILFLSLLTAMLGACQTPAVEAAPVLAVEPFLADITRAVAGDRMAVDSLIPNGSDPHSFEPTPRDVTRIAASQLLVVNGAGLESWLEKTLQSAGGHFQVVEASAGLTPRKMEGHSVDDGHAHEVDPHFWFDPTLTVRYVENIRDGLTALDPQGADTYAANAAAYINQLNALDAWIKEQVSVIPVEKRLLVTNHESFGYFADRYGFTVVGAIIPSVDSLAQPTASQFAALIEAVRASGAPAVFLETGTDPRLAEEIARETGLKVVTGLYTHSLTGPDGPAPSYIGLMKYNVSAIVAALTQP